MYLHAVRVGEMTGNTTGATHYLAQLGLLNKGLTMKGILSEITKMLVAGI